jgi:hypothetical protein
VAQKNPQQVASKWARNLGASTQDITDGVNAVTTSPTQAAAAQQAAMLQKLTAAVNNGKWARGLNRVSLADWKTAMISKGVQRVASGAQTAEPKMAKFMTDFLPVAQQVSQQVKAMPKLTLQDSKNRVNAAIDAFAAWGASRK